MKTCTRCKLTKPDTLECFSKHSQTKTGLHPWCRECHKEYARIQREGNPFQITLSKVKSRSKEKGLPFNLDTKFLELIWTGVCPVFGIPIKLNSTGTGYALPDSAALDRKVPELGYVKTNVVWLSNKANLIKQNATTDEVFSVANWMKDNI